MAAQNKRARQTADAEERAADAADEHLSPPCVDSSASPPVTNSSGVVTPTEGPPGGPSSGNSRDATAQKRAARRL
eukprot:7344879-Prymnesium_polylepis.1